MRGVSPARQVRIPFARGNRDRGRPCLLSDLMLLHAHSSAPKNSISISGEMPDFRPFRS